MTNRVLCVDDDPKLLAGLRRTLHGKFEYDVAIGPEIGLDSVRDKGPYAVVVADMQMPGMDGAAFLSKLRACAPDTVRIMLTGDQDVATAERAINEVSVFRFLSKPCSPETFLEAIRAGVEQHRLATTERDILERTLGGSVRALMEILALSEPEIHARARVIRDCAQAVASHLRVESPWEIEVAAMLLHLGWVTLPDGLAARHLRGEPLSSQETELLERLPEISASLIAPIPRLESVAEIVRRHRDVPSALPANGEGLLASCPPLGARILHGVTEFAALREQGLELDAALSRLRARGHAHDPAVLDALAAALPRAARTSGTRSRKVLSVDIGRLVVGTVTAGDIQTTDGRLLMRTGMQISRALLERIRAYDRLVGIQTPILIEEASADQLFQ